MRIRKGKKFIISTSTDGCIIIAEVDGNRELERGEYQISESCLNRNVACGTFKDMKNKCEYNGRIYALASDL